jgi:hypothetical protein
MADTTDERFMRRLAGALGKLPADVQLRRDDTVISRDGSIASLWKRGNVAYYSSADGTEQSWYSNGRRLSDTEADRL